MGKTVYLCEKPDAARMVANAIGDPKPCQGGFTARGNTVVTYAFGHLLSTYEPHEYDERFKSWDWENLPIIPDPFKFKPKDGKASSQLKVIGGYLKEADRVVMATDADREGELIGYEILKFLKWKGPTQRLWISDLTPAAIRKALAELKPIEETTPLAHAALARQRADWIVGMNMTRAATNKLQTRGQRGVLSIGRVQTPTLALIVRREFEIRNFRPEPYFDISIEVRTAAGHVLRLKLMLPPGKRIATREEADAILAAAKGAKGPLRVKEEAKKQSPPPLPDLDRIQQQCNIRFGLSADKTLELVQSLYETHQLVTYPRTDCTFLPEEHKTNVPQIGANVTALPAFASFAGAMASPVVRPTVYSDKDVTAHHAIVPTLKEPDLGQLNADEKRVYELICAYWLAAHLPDHEYLAKSVLFQAGGNAFVTRGTTPTVGGWRDVFGGADEPQESEKGSEEDEDAGKPEVIPPVRDGEPAEATDGKAMEKQTKPPARFTEASLLKAMKSIASFVEDERAKKVLSATAGIGTPATRANIIKLLKTREYIEVSKRKLLPTEKGIHLIESVRAVVPSYADPVVTAFWEEKLDGIAKKTVVPDDFVRNIAEKIGKDVALVRDSTAIQAAPAPAGGDGGRRDAPRGGAKGPSGRGGGGGKSFPKGGGSKGGTPINVPFDKRDEAKRLGARWDGDKKTWYVPADADPAPFKAAGFL